MATASAAIACVIQGRAAPLNVMRPPVTWSVKVTTPSATVNAPMATATAALVQPVISAARQNPVTWIVRILNVSLSAATAIAPARREVTAALNAQVARVMCCVRGTMSDVMDSAPTAPAVVVPTPAASLNVWTTTARLCAKQARAVAPPAQEEAQAHRAAPSSSVQAAQPPCVRTTRPWCATPNVLRKSQISDAVWQARAPAVRQDATSPRRQSRSLSFAPLRPRVSVPH